MSFSEWEMTRLSEVVDVLGDGLHGTPKYTEDGNYYFINGNNLDGKIVIGKDTKRVSHDEYLKYKKELNDRTIFVSINGTLGKVALYNGENVVLGKSACYFNVNKDVNKQYVKYVMLNNDFKLYMNTHSTGTTIKNMGLKAMREYPFALPPIAEQNSIAHILSTLDEKIEVNNQINKTLESMAQALFKQWFIDFEFPNENGEPYKSSGGEMVESELGLIPKGWTVCSIDDLTETVSKGTTPTKSNIDEALDSNIIKFIKVKDLDENGNVNIDNVELIPESVHLGVLKRSVLKEHDLLFSIAGTLGRIAVVDLELHNSNTNQALAFLRLKEYEKTLAFVMNLLKAESVQNELISKAVQAVQANISLGVLKSLLFAMPSEEKLTEYNSVSIPIYRKQTQVNAETRVIKRIRDTLLPKLMSGEIRVPIEDN
jgi:type I restriction enzyme S subunit